MIYNYPILYVFLAPTAAHSFTLAHVAYGQPPTHQPNTGRLTHPYTRIKMSEAPLTMSDSVLFAGGCWVSLLFNCAILSEQETALYGGIFLMAPSRHRNTVISLISLMTCMSEKMSRVNMISSVQGYVGYHPEDQFLITL